MGLFLFKRLITLLATLAGASVVVFLVLEVLPGDAAQMLMGPDASPEAVQALAIKLGLNLPPMTRYWQWISGLLVGDMGMSNAYSSPVLDLVLERLAVTVPLAVIAMVMDSLIPTTRPAKSGAQAEAKRPIITTAKMTPIQAKICDGAKVKVRATQTPAQAAKPAHTPASAKDN